jgi:putative resolvase
MKKRFVGGKEASTLLGVHPRTLYQWEDKGLIQTIRTPGGKRLYNVEKYIEEKQCKTQMTTYMKKLNETKGKLNISYVRVSSLGQKNDLERQKEMLIRKYPKNILVQDIGSGMNFNKKGIRKIIHLAIDGRINKLVVAFKDRLTRFGFELIEELITKYSGGKIIVINKKDDVEPEEELASDVLQVMNIFVEKMNGLRKYKKRHKKIDKASKTEPTSDSESGSDDDSSGSE